MNPIHILVVDDHPIIRRAMIEVIADESDMVVVGEAGNGQVAVSQADSLQPDLVILDLLMPVKDGVQAAREIHAANPATKILVLTSSTVESNVLAAIQAGATGYLCKDTEPKDILNAIRTIMAEGMYLMPAVTARLIKELQKNSGQPESSSTRPQPLKDLTAREREILELLGQGLSNRAIAQKLTLSEATIRSHVYHILFKLGLEERNQAIIYALRSK